MSEIKNGGLDQYGAEPFERQQFGTAGVEGVKKFMTLYYRACKLANILSVACPLLAISYTF